MDEGGGQINFALPNASLFLSLSSLASLLKPIAACVPFREGGGEPKNRKEAYDRRRRREISEVRGSN